MKASVDLAEVDLQREDLAGQDPPSATAAGRQVLGPPLGRSRRTRCRTRIELRSPDNLHCLHATPTRPQSLSSGMFSTWPHREDVFERLFLAAFAVMVRIRTVFADKGYDAEHHRDLCRRFGAKPYIHRRGRPRGSGLGKRRRPVERSNAWVPENRRLALRYDRLGFVVQSLLHAACIFLAAGGVARRF
jgi:transposase